ncbi:MAG: PilZ domain-containing protein [Candidatus Krumholzibacteriia bacterium]
MKVRRVFERRESVLQADVSDAATGEVVGLLTDISSGGMMLRTEAPLPRGDQRRLRVELPAADQRSGQLVVEAAVRWCEPDLDPSAYLVGFEFRGLTPPGCVVVDEIRRRLGQAR